MADGFRVVTTTGSRQPGRRAPGSMIGAVPYIFGVCRASALPGPVLVALLGDLGLTQSAAKALVHRVAGYGLLDLTRHGRVGVYRLAGQLRANFEQLRGAGASADWDGRFHVLVYDVPESRRALREAFLSAAARFGYRQLRPGVVVALRDASAGLGDLLSAAAAVTGWLDVDASASTRLIEHAWDLPALAGRYGDVISRLDAIKTAEADPLVAFRSLYEASSEAYQLLGEEGSLPRVALPEDWPAGRLGEALGRVLALLGPAATGHADAVINASRHAALVERDPGWG